MRGKIQSVARQTTSFGSVLKGETLGVGYQLIMLIIVTYLMVHFVSSHKTALFIGCLAFHYKNLKTQLKSVSFSM
jgi:hypothetical protein